MDREFIFSAVSDERRSLADLFDGLDEAQLAAPSLCESWDVRTVAAHLVSVFDDGFWTFQWAALRHGGVSRAIDHLARRRAQRPIGEIIAMLRDRADHRLSPPVTGPLSGLADVLVHRGDVAIPLQLPFAPDHRRVALALDFLTGPRPLGFVPRGRLIGLQLISSDSDTAWGDGAEVRGPTAMLMMAAAGRVDALARLAGAGVPELRTRLAAPDR